MSVVQELGSGSFSWRKLGTGIFSVLCVAIGLFAVVTLASTRVEVNAVRSADVCASSGQVDGCLEPVPGRITDTRRDSRGLGVRYHFVPSEAGADDPFVRFLHDNDPEDLTPGLAAVLSGREVTGLAWDGEVVGFDAAGQRVWTIGYEAGGWTSRLWMGVFFLSLGVVGLMGVVRPRRPAVGLVGLGLVGTMLGSLVALALPSLRAQVIGVLVLVAAFVALGLWGQARAARAARGPGDPPVHHAQG
ncbi:hypothetical protein H5V45_15205 [Nocardioides sp. KIGAM211]|uniref:Uncharacterized protein n=1 Tax=Nocardioides luti TaxID=2761101 RepID=A0A7X0RI28_9ACTN|nr:hypothetical protein [Nocardioides luti]MBB6628672.1 hypothetical protein [Nocardioides luti]